MFIATPAEGVPVCGGGLWCTRTVAEGVPVSTNGPQCTQRLSQRAGELAEREKGEP